MASFGNTSRERMEGLDSDLVRLFEEVVKTFDCTVLKDGGLRTPARQQELFDLGVTKTLNSNHLTGNAIDIVPYPVDWEDRERQYRFASFVFDTAMRMGIRVRWGGWFRAPGNKIFYDSPHWEKII